jgi:hypothetical protein
MKRLLLLSLPLLFLSCDGQVPSEPSAEAPASVPLFAPNKPSAGLYAYCVGCTSTAGNSFFTGGSQVDIYFNVCDATKGTVLLYRCLYENSVTVNTTQCDDKIARWKSVDGGKKRVTSLTTCDALMLNNTPGTVGARGWKLKYRAQGSGFLSEEYTFNVYSAAGP